MVFQSGTGGAERWRETLPVAKSLKLLLALCATLSSHLIGIASTGFYPSVGFADTSPVRGGFSQA